MKLERSHEVPDDELLAVCARLGFTPRMVNELFGYHVVQEDEHSTDADACNDMLYGRATPYVKV